MKIYTFLLSVIERLHVAVANAAYTRPRVPMFVFVMSTTCECRKSFACDTHTANASQSYCMPHSQLQVTVYICISPNRRSILLYTMSTRRMYYNECLTFRRIFRGSARTWINYPPLSLGVRCERVCVAASLDNTIWCTRADAIARIGHVVVYHWTRLYYARLATTIKHTRLLRSFRWWWWWWWYCCCPNANVKCFVSRNALIFIHFDVYYMVVIVDDGPPYGVGG